MKLRPCVAAAMILAAQCANPTVGGVVTATWNGTSALWTDATRWSTNPVIPNNAQPLPGDLYAAVINGGSVGLNSLITIEDLGIGQAVSTARLRFIGGGSLTVNQSVTVGSLGNITLAGSTTNFSIGGVLTINGGTVEATAAAATVAAGTVNINGGALTATGGGQIFTTPPAAINAYDLRVQVTSGSTVNLSNLNTTTMSTSRNWLIRDAGSSLIAPNLATLTMSGAGVSFIQAQTGGSLNLSGLTTIANPSRNFLLFEATGTGSVLDLTALPHSEYSDGFSMTNINVGNNGTMLWSNPTVLNGIELTISGGSLTTGQITALTEGRLNVAGSISDDFDSLTNLDNSSLGVSGGVSLALPSLQNVTFSGGRVWNSNGTGSVLSLPSLQSVTLLNGLGSAWQANSESGGRIEFTAMTSITNATRRVLSLATRGAGSVLDISALPASEYSDGLSMTDISVDGGSTFLWSNPPALHRVDLTLWGGSLTTGQLASFTNAVLLILSPHPDDFDSLSNLNDAGVTVDGGATLSAPSLQGATFLIGRTWFAQKAGSVLAAPNLADLSVGSMGAWEAQARLGASINLSGLTSINNPSRKSVKLIALTTGVLDVSGLPHSEYADATSMTEIDVRSGGTILWSKPPALHRVDVTLEGGSLTTNQITAFTDAKLSLRAANLDNFNSLSIADGSSFESTSSTAVLNLPALLNYTANGTGTNVRFDAFVNSTLSALNLTTITLATKGLILSTQTGGALNLPSLTTISNLVPLRGVDIIANAGPIDLSGLQSVVGGTGSELTATNNGIIRLSPNVQLTNFTVGLQPGGRIIVGLAATPLTEGLHVQTGATMTLTNGTRTLQREALIDGSLLLSGGTTNFNDATVTISGLVNVTGGTINFNNTGGAIETISITNTGTLRIDSAQFAFNNVALNFDGAFEVLNSTATVPNPVSFSGANGAVEVIGGTITNTGTVSVATNAIVTKLGSGSLSLNGLQNWSAGSRLQVNAGVVVINSDLGAGTARPDLQINSGTAIISVPLHLGPFGGSFSRGIGISSAGNAIVTPDGANTLVVDSVSVNLTQGRLDLTDNAMIVDYTATSPLDSVRDQLASGHASGDWDGTGINSSLAAAGNETALGYALSSQIFNTFPAVFAGETIDSTCVLVRYTLYGDANLDQVVNISDFAIVAANFNQGPGFSLPPKDWVEGDFDYNRGVNISDFALLASNFNQTIASLSPPSSSVPEPTALATVLVFAVLHRRDRRQ